MASLVDRMMGAARLDVKTYEEVEADQNALGQAMTVVVLSAVAAGIGSSMRLGIGGLISVAVISLLGWFVWALLTRPNGTKVQPEANTHADIGQLLRTIGFSASPGVLQVLGLIPFLGVLITFIISIWMLIAMVIAVRQALDYSSTGRAVGVVFIGWLVNLFITFTLFAMLAYNASLLPLAVAGLLKPWMAALGMSLSSLLVVANASRLVRERRHQGRHGRDRVNAADALPETEAGRP